MPAQRNNLSAPERWKDDDVATTAVEAALDDVRRLSTLHEIAAILHLSPQEIDHRTNKKAGGRAWLDLYSARDLLRLSRAHAAVATMMADAIWQGQERTLPPLMPTRALQDLLSIIGQAMADLAPLAPDLLPAAHPLALDLCDRLETASATLRHALQRSRP